MGSESIYICIYILSAQPETKRKNVQNSFENQNVTEKYEKRQTLFNKYDKLWKKDLLSLSSLNSGEIT